MNDWEAFFHQPKPIDELIKNALIVVDTNVLLSAYQWRDITVKEMVKALEKLSIEGRLVIPLQVIQEFSKNRPKEIIQRINDLESLLSNLQPQKSLNQIVPVLDGRENFLDAYKIQESYNAVQQEYRKSLIKLRDDLKALFFNDSYFQQLNNIAQNSLYKYQDSKSDEELNKEALSRFKEKKPPGYKDNGKEENSVGDFIIWYNILSLKSDVIFVSGDKKTDWVYRDKQGNPIGARRELIEEFFIKTNGKDFAHLSPKEFITILNPTVSDEVKEDLNSKTTYQDENISTLQKSIRKALYNYDQWKFFILNQRMNMIKRLP